MALPFDLDGNTASFSATEKKFMSYIWSRVAEDYAPFKIDITTEEPTRITARTARLLITKSIDARGVPMPQSPSGGVSYVGYFGTTNFVK